MRYYILNTRRIWSAMLFAIAIIGLTLWYRSSTEIVVQKDISSQATTSADSRREPRWQREIIDTYPGTATDTVVLERAIDAISEGVAVSYSALQQADLYTTDSIQRITEEMASSVRIEPIFTPLISSDLSVSTDISREAMLSYRSKLRIALEPLLSNTEPEFDLFARFVETKDTSYLEKISVASAQYKKAVSQARLVTVPSDAVDEHLGILNSLLKFSTVLDDIALHGEEPVASIVLLRTFTAAETEVYLSFQNLARYYVTKNEV